MLDENHGRVSRTRGALRAIVSVLNGRISIQQPLRSTSYPYAQAPGTAPSPYSKATGAVAYGKFMDGGAAKACLPGSTVFTAETFYQGTNYACPTTSPISYVCKVPV